MHFIKYSHLIFFISIFFSFQLSANEEKIKNIYVSNNATESGVGSISAPLNSISDAIKKASKLKNKSVNIFIREGTYYIDESINLTSDDSREANYPLNILAYENEVVNINGAQILNKWTKVHDQEILNRLPAKSRNHVYVTNLSDYGITDFGSAKFGGVELYQGDKQMQIARYPNDDMLKINKLVHPNTKIVRSVSGSETGEFYYEDKNIDQWQKETDIYLSGYWFWDWSQEIQKIANIDIKNKIITLEKPDHYYGYRERQSYFAFNILRELDTESEWYLNRDTGYLYFYPGADIEQSSPILSVKDNLITLNSVSNVSIKNITFSHAKNNGVSIIGGSNNLLDNIVVKHIGNTAVTIKNSDNTKIVSSNIFSVGAAGITVMGGDRDKLISANICVINNKIHGYAKKIKTYQPGISLNGVGNCAINNEIYNAPHIAIYFQGNNHSIKYNEIHNVVKESNDAGAIYAGRDWTSRGTVIEYNFLHDINGYEGNGAKGIYLDDEFSGATIANNIFDDVYDAVFIGGGKDNIVNNNLFINTVRSIYIDARGIGWAQGQLNQLIDKLNEVPHETEIWRASYPKLSSVVTTDPRLPVGNVISNNVFYDRKWNAVAKMAKPYIKFFNNYDLTDEVPSQDYSVGKKLKGFKVIPFEKIGVQ